MGIMVLKLYDLIISEDVKPGWVRLGTNFVFEDYEIDYILEAIKMIALNGDFLSEQYL